MPILKIKDKNGNVVEIPAMRGPRGERGIDAYAKAKEYGYTGTEEEFYLAMGQNGTPVTTESIGAATTVTYAATVSTAWVADDDFFYQDIDVPGILATDNPIVDILCGSENAANKGFSENMCKVFRITTSANSIRVWATEAISTAFPIQLKVVR